MLLPDQPHSFRAVLHALHLAAFLCFVKQDTVFETEVVASFPKISLGVGTPTRKVFLFGKVVLYGIQRNFGTFVILQSRQ